MVTLDELQPKEYEDVSWRFQSERVLTVHRLATDPVYMGQGLASELMQFAEELAVQQGLDCIRLDAYAPNMAVRKWYQKRDFLPVEEILLVAKNIQVMCFEKSMMT